MKTVLKVAFAGVIVLGVAAGWFWPRKPASGAINYRTASIERGSIVQTVTATGQLSPVTEVQVGSQVSGTIEKLYVDFNDTVKKGQLLAEIEPSTYQARVVQAEGELEGARATLDLRRLNAERAADLVKNRLIAQSEYDQAAAELRQQQATVTIREASLRSAQVDLERTKIYSPIDGVVVTRSVDEGQTVQASFSAPELFVIAEDLRRMEISASVSEADIGGVASGQSATFTVDAFPDRTFAGTVRQVRASATLSQNVVTYATIISVVNDDLRLLPGMTASVEITTARRDNVLRVPNAALRFKPPSGAVIVTKEADAGGESAVASDTSMSPEPPPEDQAGGDRRGPPSLDQMPAEFRERLLARFDANGNGKIDADEEAAMRAEREARFGSGGPPPGAMPSRPAASASAPASEVRKAVYVLDSAGTGALVPTEVETGITDGAYTEISRGLSGDETLVTGTLTTAAVAASETKTNPFMPTPPRNQNSSSGNRAGSGPPPPPM